MIKIDSRRFSEEKNGPPRGDRQTPAQNAGRVSRPTAQCAVGLFRFFILPNYLKFSTPIFPPPNHKPQNWPYKTSRPKSRD